MRVQPENKKTMPRGSQSGYKENMLGRKGACHSAIPTVASTMDHWQSSLSGNAWLDYGMCAVLSSSLPLPLNSSLIFASTAVLVIPPCPEAASEKYYSQQGRGGQRRGGEELWES